MNSGCGRFFRHENWDYPYSDMLLTVVNDYESCCSMCWHQASCILFSYSPTSKHCWVKSKVIENGGYAHSDRISGLIGMLV